MEETFYYNQKRKLLHILVWCMMIGLMGFVSLEETKPYEQALEAYETVPQYSTDRLDITGYLERQEYDRAHSKYQFRVIRSIIIASIGVLGLYFIIKPRKILVTDSEIKAYSWFRRKPYIHKKWEEVYSIHIGAGTGLHGILGGSGLQVNVLNQYDNIESEYIATNNYKEADRLNQMIMSLTGEDLEVIDRTYHAESIPVKTMLKDGFDLLKKNYKIYYLLASVSFIFSGLQQYFKTSPANFVALIGVLYFGYRATGALYHHAMCDIRGQETNFDKSWAYSQTQVGRIIGASILQDMSVILVTIVAVLTIMSELPLWQKMVVIVPLAVIAFVIVVRLFLIAFIAGIIDKKYSYLAINTYVVKKNYKNLLVLSSIHLLYMLVIGFFMYPYIGNIMAITGELQKFTYVNIVFGFLMTPIYTCCGMCLLKNLKFKEEGIVEEEVEEEVEEGGVVLEEIL